LKVATYVNKLSQEAPSNLVRTNELVFGLQKVKDSDIDQFIHYYGKDQLSEESQDTDFNDAGQSLNEILDCSYGELDEPEAEQQDE